MTFSTDWDIEKYRTEYECEEHWELRRRFLETHKDKYPEDKLVCLAQVFYNVEFLGCRYPEKTMRLVAKLSQGVADDHREKMKTKLQRTFVQASDAASSKVKGRSRSEDTTPKIKKHINFQKSSEENPQSLQADKTQTQATQLARNGSDTLTTTDNSLVKSLVDNQSSSNEATSRKKKNRKRKKSKKTPEEHNTAVPTKKPKMEEWTSKLVLIESAACMNPYGIISRSTSASHMALKQDSRKINSGFEVTLSIENRVLAKGEGPSLAEAKASSAQEGLQLLRKKCFTLILKDRLAGSVVDTSVVTSNEKKEETKKVADNKISRMMQLMGWSGGGLGKNEEGRVEPVQATECVKRAGLGLKSDIQGEFQKSIRKILNDFRSSAAKHDLVFASDFSKEQRQAIHNIAQKLGLKSVSYGKDPDRQLVVSRKQTPFQILQEVMEAGGSTSKYDMRPPEDDC